MRTLIPGSQHLLVPGAPETVAVPLPLPGLRVIVIQRQTFVPTHCRVGAEAGLRGFKSWPGHELAVWSWASCLPSLYLSFLFWK